MGEENTSKELTPIEQRWEEISQIIGDYLDKVGAKAKKPERVDKILNMPYDELKGLTAEDCGEYSFVLGQFALYIQGEYNYHKSKVDWCDLALTYMTSNYGEQSTYVRKDEKAAKLSLDNSTVKAIMKMMAIAKTIVLNLEGIAFRISSLANALESLQQTKRRIRHD